MLFNEGSIGKENELTDGNANGIKLDIPKNPPEKDGVAPKDKSFNGKSGKKELECPKGDIVKIDLELENKLSENAGMYPLVKRLELIFLMKF